MVDIRTRTFLYSQRILHFIRSFDDKPESRIFRSQLARSGTSIGANLVEAWNAQTKKQYVQYLHIALRSAEETVYWLQLCEAPTKQGSERQTVLVEGNEIAKILATMVLKAKGLR